MGVVRRQGIKHSIVTFTGILLGMVNVLVIYTTSLTKQELGLIRFLVDTSMLLIPFITLGFSGVGIRYFPQLKNAQTGHFGFLGLLLLAVSIGVGIFGVTVFLLQSNVLAYYGSQPDAKLFLQYLPYILVLAPAMAFADLLYQFSSNFQRITVPALIQDVGVKLLVGGLAIAYYFHIFKLQGLVSGITVVYVGVTCALFIYLWKLRQLNLRVRWSKYPKSALLDMGQYAGFALLSGFGGVLATRLDSFMVGSLIDLDANGVYTIALFVVTVVGVPMKSVYTIYGPVVADNLKNNQLTKVEKDYRTTALVLMLVGTLILTGIWSSIDPFFRVLPNGEGYEAGKYVVLLLGLAKLADMSTSLNTHIIAYSEYYRFNLYVSLALAALNIGFNLLFIFVFSYGLLGVALATLLSGVIYNLAKVAYVYYRFRIQPFTAKFIWVFFLGLFCYAATLLLPDTANPFLNIVLNSITVALLFIGTVYYTRLSPDFNQLIRLSWNKLFGRNS